MKRRLPWGHLGAAAWLVLIYLYVLGPAAVVIIGSFNTATSFPSDFEGFTFGWYAQLADHGEFLDALIVSIQIGFIAAFVGSVTGIPVALALARYEFRGKGAITAFVMAPLILPQIVLGMAMLQLLTAVQLPATFLGLALIHAVFVMPYVIRAMLSCLAGLSPSVSEAAASLGANAWRRFLLITLPITRAGIMAGFIFAFIMSFINLPLSLFLTTPTSTTLPIRMFAYMESRIDPFIAAVGSLTVLAVIAGSFFIEKVLKVRLLA
jgi:putative spermidine/putrescine transport system permease protein